MLNTASGTVNMQALDACLTTATTTTSIWETETVKMGRWELSAGL